MALHLLSPISEVLCPTGDAEVVMKSRGQKRRAEDGGQASRDETLNCSLGGVAGQVVLSQQDYEATWMRIEWPPAVPVAIECSNPHCSSRAFEWERLASAIESALDGGSIVAGSLRCEGMDMVSMSRCTNTLVYLWDGETDE